MKRHPALRALSSDHHQGLVHARRLLKASSASEGEGWDTELAYIARDFLSFWEGHTRYHFREEEEVLLPAFARYGDPSLPAVVRVLVEHVHIRSLIGTLRGELDAGAPSPGTMRALGDLFQMHIRHEEDVLFPLIEQTMPEEALMALPAQMAEIKEQK